MKNKLIFVLTTLVIILFIISFSISIPIVIRPFYYVQIDNLKLVHDTGFSKEQIKEAYDEMLDYCLYLTDDFSTGDLSWSESGKAHFADVRQLFLLDLHILAATSVFLIIYTILIAKRKYTPYRLFGYTSSFYSSIILVVLFSVTGILCAADFNRAFTVFHHIFFPGKDNWLFNYKTDEIILILPTEFFMRCALCILTSIVLLCASCIIFGILRKKFPYWKRGAANKENTMT